MVKSNLNLTQGRIWLLALRKYFPELPSDPRTLLRTPRQCKRKEIGEGSYVHVGLESSIKHMLCNYGRPIDGTLKLQLHIDGLSIFSSSNFQLWPIQCRVLNIAKSSPFVVGIYAGKGKPLHIGPYLEMVISELKDLIQRGLALQSDVALPVQLCSVICDAPARTFVLQVKAHSGYYGCDKCSQRGIYCRGRMTFPDLRAHLRTDVHFRRRSQPGHHIGVSPFEELPIDMIQSFPSDYMHMVCHGVTRRLLHMWISSKSERQHRIGSTSVHLISERLHNYRLSLPIEFSRLCRGLEDLERWKAVEFRQFLLYLGPIVLKGILTDDKYRHFMLLSIAIYVLCHPKLCNQYASFAGQLLQHFVQQMSRLYGSEVLVYNVHGLLHLPHDVENHGPLDSFSAFPYESHMNSIKRSIHGSKNPGQQLYRRIVERQNIQGCEDVTYTKDDLGRYSKWTRNIPNSVIRNGVLFTNKSPNNAVIIDGQPCLLITIFRDVVTYKTFQGIHDLHNYHIPSSQLYIYKSCNLLDVIHEKPISSIKCKCLFLTVNAYYVFIPILHTFMRYSLFLLMCVET